MCRTVGMTPKQEKMGLKRPFGGEDSHNVACCKHWRQAHHSAEVVCKHLRQPPQFDRFNVDVYRCKGASRDVRIPDGENEDASSKYQGGGTATGESDFKGTDIEHVTNAPGGMSNFLWVNSSLVDEHRFETVDYSSTFPGYFDPDHRLRAIIQPDGMYYISLEEHSLRKVVPVGPDHQVYVPDWREHDLKNSLESSDPLSALDADQNIEKMIGTCILPMPDGELSANDYCARWSNDRRCQCFDLDSIECVRQHIVEAREDLKENLGEKRFEELGFCDMGEEVANKWSEEEEQLYNDVVLSNPTSLNSNFWDHLPLVFPSKTRKDLVSYYFNVFVLRKRAEQNRFDPLHIDSDDDEWQRSDLGLTEEDEDSGGESQIDQVAPVLHDQEGRKEECPVDTVEADESYEDVIVSHDNVDGEAEGDLGDIAESHLHSNHDSGFNSQIKLSEIVMHDDGASKPLNCQHKKIDSSVSLETGADTRDGS